MKWRHLPLMANLLGPGFWILLFVASMQGCTKKESPLGSEDNPVKLFFVPSVEAKTLEDNSQVFKKYLEKVTPYHFRVSIPMNYITVVEAFGTKRADVAALNPFGYILANEKYGAEAKLTVVRHGASTYKSQILVPADSGIEKLEDLAGKTFAYVDPASTSGYMMPKRLFLKNNIELGQTVFAKKHDNVVSMIYRGQVDAGATFYSPKENGEIQDARRLVMTQFPDVTEKIKILTLTEAIPNDPIVFRKGMDPKIVEAVSTAFQEFVASPEGKESFRDLYGVTGLIAANDSDYDQVRELLKAVGVQAGSLVKEKD